LEAAFQASKFLRRIDYYIDAVLNILFTLLPDLVLLP
jgi:hypothetical protein